MQDISIDDLANVTGGKTSTSDQILTAVQGLQSSIKDLSNNNNNNNNNSPMLFLAMAMAMKNRSSTVVGPGYAYTSY